MHPRNETNTISLLMMSDACEADWQAVIDEALEIYDREGNQRFHKEHRADKNVRRGEYQYEQVSGRKPDYVKWRSQLASQISGQCLECQPVSEGHAMRRNSLWTDAHEKELQFNAGKLRKRKLDAIICGVAQASGQDDENDVAEELQRRKVSLKARLVFQKKVAQRWFRCYVVCVSGELWPPMCLAWSWLVEVSIKSS